MKRKVTLSIVLMLSVVLLSPVGFDTTAEARRTREFTGDTGLIALGANQLLRITVSGTAGNDTINVTFRRMFYTGTTNVNNGVATLASENTSAPITLAPGEAVVGDWDSNGSDFVRGVVTISGFIGTDAAGTLRATGHIINVTTGQVNGIIAILIH